MTVIYAIIAAIFGGAAGWFISSFLYYALALALGSSDMEGGLAMGAVFGVGPLGAIAGSVAGAATVIYLRRGSDSNIGRTSIIAVAIIAAALFGGYSWLNSGMHKPQFPQRGPKPILNYEIEVTDAGWPQPADYDGKIELHTFDRHIYPDKIGQRHDSEAGLHRVTGRIPLLHRYDRRQFAFWISNTQVYYFELTLPEVPEAEDGFGDWFVADHVGSRVTGTSKKPGPDSPVRMRTKITWE